MMNCSLLFIPSIECKAADHFLPFLANYLRYFKYHIGLQFGMIQSVWVKKNFLLLLIITVFRIFSSHRAENLTRQCPISDPTTAVYNLLLVGFRS